MTTTAEFILYFVETESMRSYGSKNYHIGGKWLLSEMQRVEQYAILHCHSHPT